MNPVLVICMTPHAIRLLLRQDQRVRLTASLPRPLGTHLGSLEMLVDGLAEVVTGDLSVVWCVERWTHSAAPGLSTSCAAGPECAAELPDNLYGEDDPFERLLKHAELEQP